MEYKEITGLDGRRKILTEDGVGVDKETFHNLFDGVCDTYVELPRMIKIVANDISKEDDIDTIAYHVQGLRSLALACSEALEMLIEHGKRLGMTKGQLNPDIIEDIEIHLDNILGLNTDSEENNDDNNYNFRRRF